VKTPTVIQKLADLVKKNPFSHGELIYPFTIAIYRHFNCEEAATILYKEFKKQNDDSEKNLEIAIQTELYKMSSNATYVKDKEGIAAGSTYLEYCIGLLLVRTDSFIEFLDKKPFNYKTPQINLKLPKLPFSVEDVVYLAYKLINAAKFDSTLVWEVLVPEYIIKNTNIGKIVRLLVDGASLEKANNAIAYLKAIALTKSKNPKNTITEFHIIKKFVEIVMTGKEDGRDFLRSVDYLIDFKKISKRCRYS